MDELKKILPTRIYEILERANLCTPKQILLLSVIDIKKLTNLHTVDINILQNAVANHYLPETLTCDNLVACQKVKSGCVVIDELLRGGLRTGTITEVYGESGSGKTQIALQAVVHNWYHGSVYICTEDLFPVKRFDQIKQSIPGYNASLDYGKNVFIEHITEANDLLSCLRVRLLKLLDQKCVSLIIIDSIAGPFRSEYSNYIQRAEDLRELAMTLISVAQKYNLAVLCINQATDNFSGEGVLPTLGLAWSNMICTRLWLHKTNEIVNSLTSDDHLEHNVVVRELIVTFAPDLPNSKTRFTITPRGLQSL